jgi:hypothetical protein
MAAKITVNGTSYDSVEAMPPEARRLYEQTLANLPELADRDGDGIPDLVQGGDRSMHLRTVVRKKFVVNGTTYDDESQLPPEIRRLYEKAIHQAQADPTVKKNEIKVSFQVTGPKFALHRSTGSSFPADPSKPDGATTSPAGTPMPIPIEPESGSGARLALVAGACAAVGLLFWLLTRAR